MCIEEHVGEQNTSECINYGPIITNIIDIPKDQGGNVYLYFAKSPLDTTMYGIGIEMYSGGFVQHHRGSKRFVCTNQAGGF